MNLETNQKTVDLSKKIKLQIQEQDPISPTFFGLRNIFFVGVIGVCVSLAIIILALFVQDFRELQSLLDIAPEAGRQIWQSFLFELVMVIGILISLSYLVYRRTDWIGVRSRKILITGLIGLVLVGGLALVVSPVSAAVEERGEELVEKLPFRKDRRANLMQNLDGKNIFIGEVVEINREEGWFKVKNQFRQMQFYIKKRLQFPSLGQKIILKYEQQGDRYYVRMVLRKKVNLWEKLDKESQENI
ncbi:MAG: hypothetical protein OHK0017_10440 [Patescibacteria group bacterium]